MNFKAAFCGFSVDNLAKAKEFYVDLLGLEITDDAMGLNLKLPGEGGIFVYEKPDHQPATYTVLNLIVTDIDAIVDEMVSTGIKFEIYPELPFEQDEKGIARAEKPEDGPTIAWFKDPAGNVLSLIQD